uniref:Sushi domain-containing protein n=1 Tax=Meloidogyne floridensis TaxID=298350 RepID=A0A915NMV3_9BILA
MLRLDTCRSSEIICSEPPLNASFSKQKYSPEFFLSPQLDRKTNKNLFGSVAFYVCPEGTIPRGNRNFAICAEDGEWTENINLACLLNGCPPFHLNFGNFTKVWTPLFSFAQIKCQEGFNLEKRIPQCILTKNTKIPVWDYVDLNICGQIIKAFIARLAILLSDE